MSSDITYMLPYRSTACKCIAFVHVCIMDPVGSKVSLRGFIHKTHPLRLSPEDGEAFGAADVIVYLWA